MYCGSGEPLWICAHAFTPNHECVYAICSNCKYKIEGNEKTKRRKRNDVDSTITTIDCNDPHSQNHKVHNLKDFCDDQYLTDTNLLTMVKKVKKCHNVVLNANVLFGTKKNIEFCYSS